MNAFRPVLLIAFGLALAGCGQDARGPSRLKPDETLLEVSATARGESKPDEARFSAGVSSFASTAAVASEQNSQRMNAIMGALKQFGVSDRDVQTQTVRVFRVDYGANRGKFEADNVVTVRVRQVDKAGEAIAAATGAGANVLSGPDLRTADPEAAARAVAGEAFKAARARADAYAAAAGLKVVRALTIRDGGGSSPDFEAAPKLIASDFPAAAPSPPVLAGVNTTEVTVSVDFALTRK